MLLKLKIRNNLLIVAGVFLIIFAMIWKTHSSRILSFSKDYNVDTNIGQEIQRQPNPIQIQIPKVNLDIPISPTSIRQGVWEISNQGASHLNVSANPGENNNIVLYAHNKNSQFGPIRWLSNGDKIVLKNSDNKSFEYEITKTFETDASQIQHTYPTEEETLTLYTCDGWFDKKRYFVIAKPVITETDQPKDLN